MGLEVNPSMVACLRMRTSSTSMIDLSYSLWPTKAPTRMAPNSSCRQGCVFVMLTPPSPPLHSPHIFTFYNIANRQCSFGSNFHLASGMAFD